MKHIKVSYSKIMPVACVWYMIAFDFHHPAESVCVYVCSCVCLFRRKTQIRREMNEPMRVSQSQQVCG